MAIPSPSGLALEQQILEGTLERITYLNEDSGWSVVRIGTATHKEPITAVGNLFGAQSGEWLRLRGHWILDKKYGEQFQVDTYETLRPATLAGIQKYLGSGLVPGVGPAFAERLVAHFGIETLQVIEENPKRLREVEGIGPKRAEQILRAWEAQREIRNVMVFLQSHGVAAHHAVKIFKQYGPQAIAIVQANPYRLAQDVFGMGFKTADAIAQALGTPTHSPQRARAGLLHVLGEHAEQGHVFVSRRPLLESAQEILAIAPPILEDAISELAATKEIVVEAESAPDSDRISLKNLHVAEVELAAMLRNLLATPAKPIAIDLEKAVAWFEARAAITLAPEQRDALCAAATSKVLVITGGPGTGKTTLVNGILSVLERKGRRITLAAPTGRAAKRLAETTGRAAHTIHRLLEFDPRLRIFKRDRESPLETNILILDEASMIDTMLARSVVRALPSDAQLILVGDVDQLPSIGPGSVLRDVIASRATDVVRLQQIFRQAAASRIITNAHRVNSGELPLLDAHGEGADFYFVERDDPQAIVASVKTMVKQHLPSRFGLDPFTDIQVLVPMNRGVVGTVSLNAELQAHLNPSGPSLTRGNRMFRTGDKVMQLRNNYDLGVFNGDVGIIEAVDEEGQGLAIRFDGRRVLYETSDLDELTLAYASTIHKAQGSEFSCVVLPIHTQHYALLQRNLLYTAITRGRKLVVMIGSLKAIAMAVRNGDPRHRATRLAQRLADAPTAFSP